MAHQGTETRKETIEGQASNPKMSAILGGRPLPEEKHEGVSAQTTEMLKRGQEFAQTVAEKAREYGAEASEEVTTILRKYPLQSLFVGFGVGCLVGVLISRR